MKVLLTSLGHLGGTVARMIAGKHDVRVLRRRSEDVPYEVIIGDMRCYDDVKRAADDVDAIIHTAALWGRHMRTHTYRDFYETNATGTFNVLEAAREEDVPKVVFASSIVVYGILGRDAEPDIASRKEALRVDETFPYSPRDAYALTKVMGEIMCEHYSARLPISTVCLRFSHFPERERDALYASHFHKGYLVDVEDCAQACVLALENSSIKHGKYQITSKLPYTQGDAADLVSNPQKVLDKYFKQELAFIRSQGVEIPIAPLRTYYACDKAEKELGFRPKYDTKSLVQMLKSKAK